jgi:hypothetical protein
LILLSSSLFGGEEITPRRASAVCRPLGHPLACKWTLCDYNGETTPPNNLVLKGEGEKICLRNRMVR